MKTEPCLFPLSNQKWQLNDYAGELLQKVTERFLISVRETNPAILDMLKNVDGLLHRELISAMGFLRQNGLAEV